MTQETHQARAARPTFPHPVSPPYAHCAHHVPLSVSYILCPQHVLPLSAVFIPHSLGSPVSPHAPHNLVSHLPIHTLGPCHSHSPIASCVPSSCTLMLCPQSASDGFWKSVATRVPKEPPEIRILNPYFIQEAAFTLIGLPFNNGLMGRGVRWLGPRRGRTGTGSGGPWGGRTGQQGGDRGLGPGEWSSALSCFAEGPSLTQPSL